MTFLGTIRTNAAIRRLTVVGLFGLIVSSCAFSRLKEDVKTGDNSCILDIRLEMDDDVSGKAIVVIYTPYKDGQRIAGFKVIDPAVKRTLFLLDPGNYRAAVFHDRDGNLNIDPGEPAVLLEKGRRLKFSDVVKRITLEISLPEEGELPPEYPRELATLPDAVKTEFHLAIGDLMDLDSPRFSKETGKMGLWEPTRFLKEYGSGIYMLEPYDPHRVPVVFVNGAGGSAQNWRYFFDHLDKSHYQAWFYLYPSGARISKLGNTLNVMIRAMAEKYNASLVHVVAHSMGGLVAREAIVRQLEEDKPLLVGQFVSISTPWNGHRMAEKGVSTLDTPVPSWHDVVPGSKFLQTVFQTRLKGRLPHHLLFGYQVGSEGDGSVDLNSVLLTEAQDDAVEVRGFEANHVSILSMELVLEYVENILSSDVPDSTASSTAGVESEEPAQPEPCTPCPAIVE